MMSTTEPATNHLANNAQTSSSRNYEADLARMRADLNTLLGTKLSQLGINPGRNRLYQKTVPRYLQFGSLSYEVARSRFY